MENPGLKSVFLQRGQVELDRSHVSMQFIWKAWLQVGSNLNLSISENSDKQTAQSNDELLAPTTSLYMKTGKVSMKDCSRPESCKWKSCWSCLCSVWSGVDGYLLDRREVIEVEEWYFVKNLTNKWSKPDMKNKTAKIMMMIRITGLILTPGEDDGFDVLWIVTLNGGEKDDMGWWDSRRPCFL